MEFEEIITIGAGTCFSVTPKSKMSKRQLNQIYIQFDESLPFKDVPKWYVLFWTINLSIHSLSLWNGEIHVHQRALQLQVVWLLTAFSFISYSRHF